jgi:hypothetical protein
MRSTLESTVFTWEPVLSPLTAPLEAPGMDQSIPIQDVNGAPYLDGSRGRAVAVLSLGASGRIVVVLDQGHVLLRNTASAYGAHDYTVRRFYNQMAWEAQSCGAEGGLV